MAVELNSYVRWPVKGGMAFGKVVNLKDEKTICIETPTGSINEVNVGEIVMSSEEEYDLSLTELVANLSNKTVKGKKTKKVEETAKAELEKEDIEMNKDTKASDVNAETVKAAVDQAKAEFESAMKAKDDACAKSVAEAKSEAEAAKKACDEAKAEAAKYKAEAEEAKAKIAEAEKAALAKTRLDEMKSCDAVEAIAGDEKAALAALAEMDQATYSAVAKVAKAGFEKLAKAGQTSKPKLTEQTQTDKPKLTEQTQTNKTKLTQASEDEATAKDALNEAEAEKDASLVTAGVSKDNGMNELLTKFGDQARKNKSRIRAIVEKKDK